MERSPQDDGKQGAGKNTNSAQRGYASFVGATFIGFIREAFDFSDVDDGWNDQVGEDDSSQKAQYQTIDHYKKD